MLGTHIQDSMTEGIRAELVVGTRLLVWWESGWESGAVGEKVTSATGGEGVTAATQYRIDYDDGESCLHDLETLRVKLEPSTEAAENGEASDYNGETEPEDATITWAQCERCEKWRKLSSGRALPKHWFCELNPNRAFASCQVAEEQWTDDGEDCFAQVCMYCKSEGKVHRRCLRLPNCHVQRDSKKKHYASRTAAAAQSRSVELRAMAQAASPASERDSPQSRALVVRCGHRAGEQPSAEALETLREWVLAHGCGGLEAGWRATTQTRRDHDGPSSGHVDRYYYSPSGE